MVESAWEGNVIADCFGDKPVQAARIVSSEGCKQVYLLGHP
jgi:hypothetical protein